MINTYRSKLFVLIFVFLPVVWSCAEMKGWVSQKISGEAPAPPPVKETAQTPTEASAQAATQAKKQMAAGAYQKAIDIYAVARQNHPLDQALLNEYVKSIEKIKSTADQASNEQDFVTAGRNYDVLLKNYSKIKSVNKNLSFNDTYLDGKLSICKKTISKQGFEEYRKGNLGGAIALWEALLDIDPQNTDIKESVNTAKLQQKNLQK
jgi:tetratricopeptide (TPR) repeat protein